MLKLLLVCSSLFLFGCGTALYKPGATQQDFDKDMAECQYDATKYGAVNSRYHGGGYGAALGSGIASGMEQGMRQNEIISQCMRLKGWAADKNTK